MNKTKVWALSLLAVCLIATAATSIIAKPNASESKITIRSIKSQTVLYTIFRGSYDKAGPAVGNLYALAGKKGIAPRGSASYCYLNNPNNVSNEHWLTEIRIPVGKEALKLAGTLGEMTDVKTLPATQVAVAVKPKGLADLSSIYGSLQTWIIKNGYVAKDSPCEVFLTNARSGDYAQMKTEIMFPVEKFSF